MIDWCQDCFLLTYYDDRGVEWSPDVWRLITCYMHLVARTGYCWLRSWLVASLVLVRLVYNGHMVDPASGVASWCLEIDHML